MFSPSYNFQWNIFIYWFQYQNTSFGYEIFVMFFFLSFFSSSSVVILMCLCVLWMCRKHSAMFFLCIGYLSFQFHCIVFVCECFSSELSNIRCCTRCDVYVMNTRHFARTFLTGPVYMCTCINSRYSDNFDSFLLYTRWITYTRLAKP